MPAQPPVAYATLCHQLPSKQYILGITPSSASPHLILRHPTPELTIADNQSLQPVDVLKGGHKGNVTSVCSDGGALWSSAKDGSVVRWDERSRQPGSTIKAFLRAPLPITALAVSERGHLVIAGTELLSAEAHIVFWDTRNTKDALYRHSSTHSDDITHLSLLPSTSTYLASSGSSPSPLLLSASTDGLVALSNVKESDEDEAVVAEENWGQSIAAAGAYPVHGSKSMGVWARSDMDGISTWQIGIGEEGEVELQNHLEYPMESLKFQKYPLPRDGPSITQTAEAESSQKSKQVVSDYIVDAIPSLGLSKNRTPMLAVGSNEGDIVLLHGSGSSSSFAPSAYFLSGPKSRGHKDVVRCIYHDVENEALYSGSEDGVLSGWSLASLPQRLMVGDPSIDDDGGDGREDVQNEDEESEIETEEEEEEDDDDSGMDVDDSEESEEGPRHGPVLGGGGGGKDVGRKQSRSKKRSHPYR
ncbi:WD40-repeat-containing domain protein [Kockovaella imperatae]|uniref:WD40-repeat-containing domain protein n=1 Tax=Kockovaella imperatae TaxID=4999 RepID=A0A1Y1UP43_9TREE|nr:WD40-repeat-containing domain protein [Kockovaella imperatae]ORX39317.1 WD40-repeat-containing domain protein [Kockovaella imperatae]